MAVVPTIARTVEMPSVSGRTKPRAQRRSRWARERMRAAAMGMGVAGRPQDAWLSYRPRRADPCPRTRERYVGLAREALRRVRLSVDLVVGRHADGHVRDRRERVRR